MSVFPLIAVIFWGLSYVAIKVALDYLSPTELVLARFILATPALGALVFLRGKSFKIKGPLLKPALYLALSGLIVYAHFWIMAEGLKTTTANNGAWILATAPVFILLLSVLTIKERINIVQGAGMAVAAIGVVFLISKGDLTSIEWIKSTGDMLMVVNCVTWAIYTVVTRKVTESVDPLVATFYTSAIAFLIFAPFGFGSGAIDTYLSLDLRAISVVVFLGVGCLALAFWMWAKGVQKIGATRAGAYLYIEPLFTVVAAYLVLGEGITWVLAGAAILITIGVYLAEHIGPGKFAASISPEKLSPPS